MSVDLPESLRSNVKYEPGPLPTPCWIWTGGVNGNGYGKLYRPRNGGVQKYDLVHILSYRMFYGAFAEGLVIDHRCRSRRCFNPDHLAAIPQKLNTLIGEGPTAINARKTECKRGHKLPEKRNAQGRRACLECARSRSKRTVDSANQSGMLAGVV
jgi:hypothetical protein